MTTSPWLGKNDADGDGDDDENQRLGSHSRIKVLVVGGWCLVLNLCFGLSPPPNNLLSLKGAAIANF